MGLEDKKSSESCSLILGLDEYDKKPIKRDNGVFKRVKSIYKISFPEELILKESQREAKPNTSQGVLEGRSPSYIIPPPLL